MQVTLKEIAARTGLSISVVSRALNPMPDKNARVSEKTRALVMAAASELQFRPNRAAQSLKRGKSPALGIFLPEYSNRLIADMVIGMSEIASAEGVPLSFHFGLTPASYEDFFRQVRAEAHSGLITYPYAWFKDDVLASKISDYHRRGGAVLMLNTQEAVPGIPIVSIDDRMGGELAAQHLLSRGCEAFLSFPRFSLRTEAFTAVLRGAGYSPQIFESPEDIAPACQCLRKKKKRKIGIFATTDRDALKLIPILRRDAWTLAHDAFLVGYDDLCLSDVCDPPLTTIHQPFREEGRIAIRKLLRLLEGQKEESAMLKPSLIVRQTT
ncbi:MAG: hypothetical protein A2X49_00140 [Lentisphaerae bacterium GWF2_52_8]|nr:MAG: hypothetical protein A2X49_00140 [Lentisphaerae bacterium GWF2_52_8]